MSDYGSDAEDETEFTCANPAVVDKYKVAAEIANKALAAALAACKPGAKVVDICNLGDKTVEEEAAKFYNKKDKDGNKIEKGIAFPTCISVNHQVCHNSPPSDDAVVL